VRQPTAHAARAYLALRATGAAHIELFFTLSAYLIAERMQRERALGLLHLPCVELVTRLLGGSARPATIAPLALGLTIALANLAYRYVESPFLRAKRRFEVVASRPV